MRALLFIRFLIFRTGKFKFSIGCVVVVSISPFRKLPHGLSSLCKVVCLKFSVDNVVASIEVVSASVVKG